jgi:hypothetical protein
MAGVQVDAWQGGEAKAPWFWASSDDNAARRRLGAGNPTASLLQHTSGGVVGQPRIRRHRTGPHPVNVAILFRSTRTWRLLRYFA